MSPSQNKSQDSLPEMTKVLFSAIITLGFNTAIQKEKLYFSEQILKRINQKVGDHLLYFLFCCINHHHSAKLFCDCWPIYDKKVEAHFRNTAFEWFKTLNQCDDFNLKPSLIVSKAVVMPTSNKFLSTVYTLCRIALHSKIVQKDPGLALMHLPVVAAEPKQRQRAMKLIQKSKIYHCGQYTQAIRNRSNTLKRLKDKAKELVERYRNIVKKRENVKEEFISEMDKDSFITQTEKEILLTVSSEDFIKEIGNRMKLKNEDIGVLWHKDSGLKVQEEDAWHKISSIINGEKKMLTISGKDYAILSGALSKESLPLLLQDRYQSCYQDGILDLAGLLSLSNEVFRIIQKSLKDASRQDTIGKERIGELENQWARVISIKNDTEETQSMLADVIQELLQSVLQLRNCFEQDSFQVKSGSFALCPPTPPLNLENGSPPSSTVASPYQLIQLTPNPLAGNLTDFPLHRFRNMSKLGTLRPYSSDQKLQATDSGSPPLSNSLFDSSHTNASSSLQTLDSGCVLSCAAESLLQSLDKLDVTPTRTRLFTGESPFSQSAIYADESNHLDDRSIDRSRSILKSTLLSSVKAKRSCLSREMEDIISPTSFFNSFNGNHSKVGHTQTAGSGRLFQTEHDFQNMSVHQSIKTRTFSPEIASGYQRSKGLQFSFKEQDSRSKILSSTNQSLTKHEFTGGTKALSVNQSLKENNFSRTSTSGNASLKGSTPVGVTQGSVLRQSHEVVEKSSFPCWSADDLAEKSKDMISIARQPVNLSPVISKLLKDLQKENESTQDGKKFEKFARSLSLATKPKANPYKLHAKENVSEAFDPPRVPLNTSVSSEIGQCSEELWKAEVTSSFQAQMASLQACLEPDDNTDATKAVYEFNLDKPPEIFDDFVENLNGVDCQISKHENTEELFLDSHTHLDHLHGKKSDSSPFLPEDPVFDTLTESIVSGHLNPDVLLQNDVESEIRRESLDISRRSSVLNLIRRNSGVTTRLSELFENRLSLENQNLLDESGSFLLSTSFDSN